MSRIFTPRPYQHRIMVHELDVPRCNIWADMGLGKTVSSLSMIDALDLCGSRFLPALVIATKRVARSVWGLEAAKWEHTQHLRVSPIIGTPAQRTAALREKAHIYTINYENLPWLVEKIGVDNWPFATVIADESTRLKGFRLRNGGKRARALSKITKRTGRWINLTGTPSPNGLIDLWGQQWFIDGGAALGRTYTAFKDRWFDENPYTRELVPRPSAEREIMAAVAPYTVSLEKDDWFDLPPTIETTVPVALPADAARLYRQMEDDLIAEVESGEVVAESGASKSMKCMQIASGVLYDDEQFGDERWQEVHRAKIETLRELLDDQGGAPTLVAYHFKADRHRILAAFNEARCIDTAQDEEDWNAGRIPLGLIHPASAGHGLNLQDGGNRIVFFTTWWNLELHQQVIERIGAVRQVQSGHDRPVFVFYLVAEGTVDEVAQARIATKASVQDAIRQYVRARGP